LEDGFRVNGAFGLGIYRYVVGKQEAVDVRWGCLEVAKHDIEK
jgi:hypothetical protein